MKTEGKHWSSPALFVPEEKPKTSTDEKHKEIQAAGHHFERGAHRKVVEKRMTAEFSVLGGGGCFPFPPANYQPVVSTRNKYSKCYGGGVAAPINSP